MFELQKLVRKNILELTPYSSARKEFTALKECTFLDANENPWGKYNRYPGSDQHLLKQRVGNIKSINSKNIFIGNGSDEAIDLLFRIFCTPGKDKAICFTPTYGMYTVAAAIQDVEMIEIPLNNCFQADPVLLEQYLDDEKIKLLFLCSPNNPTGNLQEREIIYHILETFTGIVVIDEAYIDFAGTKSLVEDLDRYSNLVVLQTLSKAWGMAALRIGMAFSSEAIVDLLNKVKPPYSISTVNEITAILELDDVGKMELHVKKIIEEKAKLVHALNLLPIVKKVYPSDANFILVEIDNSNIVYASLLKKNLVVRNRHTVIPGCLRITIGTTEENALLIKALKEI